MVAVMLFDNVSDAELAMPIDKVKIKNAKVLKLYVTDRWYGVNPSVENVTNMKNIDFGKPKSYMITFADGNTYKVHHSYVIRYEHRNAPPLVKNGWLQGWGYAEGSHIFNEISRDDEIKSAVTSLINKSNIEIIKMSGMRGVFMSSDEQNEEQLRKRLEMVNWGRTYNSLTFLDKDDSYEHYDYSLTGLSDLLVDNMYLISAALEMPGVLFETMKNVSTTDDGSYDKYCETIHNRCESYLRKPLSKLLAVLFLMNGIEEPIDFDFKFLNQDKKNTTKSESLKNFGETLSKLIDMGIISKYQAAKSIINYSNEDSIKIDFTKEHLDKLKVEEEMAILETYKLAGKSQTPTEEMIESVSGVESTEVPEKISQIVSPENEEKPKNETIKTIAPPISEATENINNG